MLSFVTFDDSRRHIEGRSLIPAGIANPRQWTAEDFRRAEGMDSRLRAFSRYKRVRGSRGNDIDNSFPVRSSSHFRFSLTNAPLFYPIQQCCSPRVASVSLALLSFGLFVSANPVMTPRMKRDASCLSAISTLNSTIYGVGSRFRKSMHLIAECARR